MNIAARQVQRTYLTLVLGNTLAASLIWGINTIFLLDAGLSNLEAFAANAFFTAGMVLFEIPTGVIADVKGRRLSFLLGTVTLALSTALYLLLWQIGAPFWAWAAVSVLLGLGFTFFSGATEAWLVDALGYTKFKGKIETVFAKAQIVAGAGMLVGAVGGGVIAQLTNLGVPYLLRTGILLIMFIVAFRLMHDLGFTKERNSGVVTQVKSIVKDSVDHGLKRPPVRWLMLAAPFVSGVSIYGFYALQPYLLELWGDPNAYAIAGVSAAILAGAQMAGGMIVPHLGRFFAKRTTIILQTTLFGTVALVLMGVMVNFWAVIGLVVLWGLLFAAATPVRQAYLNGLIPGKQRATILSFYSLLGSSGGVVIQPVLGKAADVWSYPASYVLSGAFQAIAVPFVWLSARAAQRDQEAKDVDDLSRNEDPTQQT